MTFNTALSGLAAASTDLQITGNNIANSSTTGFKASRAEFGDVYASSLLGSGSNQLGSGVQVTNVAQQFDQGTITFTNNSLDLAIDGNGFFVLSENGAEAFTRSGAFGVDEDGFIVSAGGARVQGFTANDAGTLNGIVGDLQVETGNLAPQQTTLLEAQVNLDARSVVLSSSGTNIDTTGGAIGIARAGRSNATSTVLTTNGPPAAFDFSVNEASSITAANPIDPFNFGLNQPSAVAASSPVTGFNFGLNTPSGLTSSSTPNFFNFSDAASAISGNSASVAFDYSGANSASFDISVAGSSADGVRTVTLNSNIASVGDLVAEINGQLTGIGVTAQPDPSSPAQIRFVASQPGQDSTITVDNFAANGAATAADVQASLSGINDGAASVRSSFDVSVTGGSADGTVNVSLTRNITSLSSLISDINDQLSGSGVGVIAREDPENAGRLQFASLDSGVATTVAVSNFQTTDAGVTTTDIENLLRVNDGATSAAPGAGGIGTTGSLTQASFDVSIAGGSGVGGNATATIVLDSNIGNGALTGLINEINAQLEAVPGNGIDVRAEEDPDNPGRLRFASQILGEPAQVTVGNFATSGVAGSTQTSAADISAVLGGIVEGASDSSGINTNASFQVSFSGSSTPSENQTVTVNLNSDVSTLQDLINDIRDDLAGSGIGIDVREDPDSIGRLQFFSLTSGETSTIALDPNGNLDLGNGVSQAILENALGGISLGQGGVGGATSDVPDPFGTTDTIGQQGRVNSASFDIELTGSQSLNGEATIVLDGEINSVDDLILDIRNELLQSGIGVDVRESTTSPGQLEFFATVPGENSIIRIGNLDASNNGVDQNTLNSVLNINQTATGLIQGQPGVDNGYSSQEIQVIGPDGETLTVTTETGASAAEIAADFSSTSVPGVTATAESVATIPGENFLNTSGTLGLSLNGIPVSGTTLTQIADSINSTSGLGTVSAVVDEAGDLVVIDQVGNDLVFTVTAGDTADSIGIRGSNGPLQSVSNTELNAVSVGGAVNLTLQEGVRLANAQPAVSNIFGVLNDAAFTPFELNTFDPNDQETFNNATSQTVFDSLGNPHVLSLFFVREPFDATDPGSQPNQWSVFAQIDGQDVGDPDPNLPPPQNLEPTQAQFTVQFNEDGTLNPAGSDTILISNWQPLDEQGQPNGAQGPQNILAGGSLPIGNPPQSSNFEIRLGETTQFGSPFAVTALSQDGFTTGELSGLAIDDDGLLSARFTNGETQTLGQVAIADFANVQGLSAIGDTAWVATNDSGDPLIGAPGSGSLGVVTSGALEDSNVELSEQLVQLIIAQRNFQANARTISTADEIQQTIINL